MPSIDLNNPPFIFFIGTYSEIPSEVGVSGEVASLGALAGVSVSVLPDPEEFSRGADALHSRSLTGLVDGDEAEINSLSTPKNILRKIFLRRTIRLNYMSQYLGRL